MATRLGRDSAVYAVGSFGALALGFVNLAIVSRFLSPSQYGDLAVLLILSAGLTIVLNLGSLQGTFLWVFGSAGDDAADDDPDPTTAADKRQGLTTGLAITIIISLLGTAVVASAASDIAPALLERTGAMAVALAAASGGAGAVWRLVVNVPRLAQRPGQFVVLNTMRPIAVIALTIAFLSAGDGVTGAMAALFIGSAASCAVAVAVTRANYRPSVRLRDTWRILRRGRIYIPLAIAIWAMHNIDQFILSRYVDAADVGIYRIAARMGAFVSYFTGAYLMAWHPLQLSPLFFAATGEDDRGPARVGAQLWTVLILCCAWIVLGMWVGSDLLVHVAPPAYAGAAPLIPAVSAGFIVYAAFYGFYRAAQFTWRRTAFIWLSVASIVLAAIAGMYAAPRWGAYGAAASLPTGEAICLTIFIVCSQRSSRPIPIPYARILAGIAVAGALGAAALLLRDAGAFAPAVDVAAFALFPVALVVLRIAPRGTLRAVVGGARRILAPTENRSIRGRVRLLREGDRRLLAGVFDAAGEPTPEERVEGVRVLRSVCPGVEPYDRHDSLICDYLRAAVADRQVVQRQLRGVRVDPLDLALLDNALTIARREVRRDRLRVAVRR
jgi:O-antigen/teichoic acid export membrane protein